MGEGAWPGFLGILWGGTYCSRIKSSGLMNLTWSLCPLHSRYQSSTSGLGSSPLHVWAWKGPFHIKLAVRPHADSVVPPAFGVRASVLASLTPASPAQEPDSAAIHSY